ncbi:hypothetical protein F4778DRAFT_764598 [Xylariomycetidae sp. FL2044]|nr:hypothetical protein F4778DRAFT_764598 [Xylariomycetidae sp. FL2044]
MKFSPPATPAALPLLLHLLAFAAAGVTAQRTSHELLDAFRFNTSAAVYNIRMDITRVQSTFRDLSPRPGDTLLELGSALLDEYQVLAFAANDKLIQLEDWAGEYEKELDG